jgi:sulfur carrier protein ThiS
MITVDIALFAYLSQYHADGEGGRHARKLKLPDDTRVAAVVEQLGLPDAPRVIFINGRHGSDESILAHGDRLAIFPPVAGG